MAKFVSIDPTLKDGAFLALSYHERAAELKPIPLTEGESPFASFKVFQDSMTVTAAMNLGLGSIFSTSGSYNAVALVYEAMLFTDKYSDTPVGGLIQGTRWGAGLRLVLNVRDIKAEASVSIGMVAANAQLGLAKATYEITGIGISKADILTVLPDPGDFNFENYREILDATGLVRRYMAEHTDELAAKPLAVSLTRPPSADRIERAHSVVYAMRRLVKRNTLAEALKQASAEIDVNLVREVYAEFAGIRSDQEEPSREHSNRAQTWLNG